MKVKVTKIDGGWLAELEGIYASGVTKAEVMDNLVDIIEAKFSLYTSMEAKLGSGPAQQLEAMRKLGFDHNGNLISKLEVENE